jgi:hypothetical protein
MILRHYFILPSLWEDLVGDSNFMSKNTRKHKMVSYESL